MLGDDRHLFLVEYQGQVDPETGVPIPRGVRAFQARDGKSVAIPDGTQALANRRRAPGCCVWSRRQDARKRLVLRLYDLVEGKDLWKQSYPPDSKLVDALAPDLIGVLQPDGLVVLVDLRALRERKPSRLPRQLVLDRKHLQGNRSGLLLQDASQVYLALIGPGNAGGPGPLLVEEAGAYFQGELQSTPVDGQLYAFDRVSGVRRRFLALPAQHLLLNRFEELPLILWRSRACASPTPTSPWPR